MSKSITVVRLSWYAWGLLALGFILVLIGAGCATQERFVSDEQDAEFRAKCEEHGCVVLPAQEWAVIERILDGLGLRRQ
jgi:hypothetical protein